jgi:ComF family protein
MLLDLLFPNRCLHCNSIISKEELVCEVCTPQIKFTHYNFHEENPLKNRCKMLFPVENTFALMQFEKESLSRKLVHQLKYRSQEKVGKILAKWTSEKLIFEDKKPDILVTVPLHPKKLKKRGYNQLHLFADILSKNWEIPHHKNALKRNTYQKAQAQKDKSHRAETKYDFSLTEEISEKHVLLIDDVFTTGNTLSAIAWEILKNPSNKVSILVMAYDL